MTITLITQDRLDELVRLCKQSPEGLGAEVGVYKGGSLKLLAQSCPNKYFYGYDTFSGLPMEDWNENEIHNIGDFSDNSYEGVQKFLGDLLNSEGNISLIKGYFPQSAYNFDKEAEIMWQKKMPEHNFSFIHVDTDFYEGVKSCIHYFYPKLFPGGIMVFDDYEWPNCPGVKKALDESELKYQKTNAKFQAYLIKE